MIGLGIFLAALASASPAPPQQACTPLRVMTYNIRLDLASDGPNRWSERRNEFMDTTSFPTRWSAKGAR